MIDETHICVHLKFDEQPLEISISCFQLFESTVHNILRLKDNDLFYTVKLIKTKKINIKKKQLRWNIYTFTC